MDIHRVNSPSISPLSPTIIHYQEKYQRQKNSHRNHRKSQRNNDRFYQEHIRKTTYTKSFSSHHYQNSKSNKNIKQKRKSSSIWEIHKSSNGRIYYYNIITDQSQWEKPPRNQLLSLSIKNHYKSSKRTSNHYYSKKSSSSNDNLNLIHNKKRKDHQIEIFCDEKQTPTSPPPNEIIHIDLVDPIPTCNISISSIHSQIQLNEDQNSDLSLQPSQSTINAILDLQHSYSNSNDIKRYYRNELIEHVLNWSSTKLERETIRLSNEQIRSQLYQLVALRTEIYSLRLRFQRNSFQLLQYHYQR